MLLPAVIHFAALDGQRSGRRRGGERRDKLGGRGSRTTGERWRGGQRGMVRSVSGMVSNMETSSTRSGKSVHAFLIAKLEVGLLEKCKSPFVGDVIMATDAFSGGGK